MEAHVGYSILNLACQTLRRYTETIQKNLDGAAQGQDIECIHQVRVACRRLRTALRLFAEYPNEGLVQKWRKESKRLRKDLRKARDLDVQIQFLEELFQKVSSKHKKALPGIQRLGLRLRQDRQRLQKRTRKSAERFCRQNILTEIHLETERLLHSGNSTDRVGQTSAVRAAGPAICKMMKETMALLDCLQDKKDIQGHHRLRIAVKRLRYTLEIFEPAFENGLDAFIQPLKKMQTLLGDLNDCAAWPALLERFSTEEKERTRNYFGQVRPFRRLEAGLDLVRRNRKKRWQTLFNQVCKWTAKLEKDGFWNSLAERFAAPQESNEPINLNGNEALRRPSDEKQPL